ncbi:MAG TPA: hypothetical protein VHZ31_04695 [Solirubrobacteraceae bacterium]|jgi:hypothetical protein|nr:hypothetical protein [Solirubrobacteraceae bacterium]
MSPKTRSIGAALAAVAVSALGAGPAAADTTVVADATAQNVTAYGTTAAWSRKAADGYHLVVARGKVVADAPVPVSSRPYDPDLGPTKANGRTIVYARGGDLYRYDVGAPAEQKLTALSTKANEIAPSFFKGTIAFSRTNGKSPGLYLLRPGHEVTRLFRTIAYETDLNETRVIGRFGTRDTSIIRILNYTADDVNIAARAKAGQRMTSPTLTRFNGLWLRAGATGSAVEQVGVNAHRGLGVREGLRMLPAGSSSLASYTIPTLYTTATGLQLIAPKLRFTPPNGG